MYKTLKRLEILKTSLELDDELFVASLLDGFEPFRDEAIGAIVEAVYAFDYLNAKEKIENYLAKHSKDVAMYEDREIPNLRIELKMVELKLQNLSEAKNEYLRELADFNVKYHLELGELIEQLLELKTQFLHQKTIQQRAKIEQEKESYQELKNGYQELKNQKEMLEEKLETIDDFDDEYDALYEEILELKEELEEKEKTLHEKRKESKKLQDELKEEPIYKEYEEIKQSYKDFHDNYEDIVQTEEKKGIITTQEIQELKKMFRQTVKLCHPDIVEPNLREKAHNIMVEVNGAYGRFDIKTISRIFNELQNGFDFVTKDAIQEKEKLKEKIQNIKKAIEEIENEIAQITHSHDYLVLQEIEDFEEFFEQNRLELEEEYNYIKKDLENLTIESCNFEMEQSDYANKLRKIDTPTFDKIRRVCLDFMKQLNAGDTFFESLQRGTKIIDDTNELYQYIVSFGKMHKAKLYDSFDVLLPACNNTTLNIIDWGCGQALATSLLLDYIKERNLRVTIKEIILIEPSILALKRGVLHVDVLQQKQSTIKAIHKDIDSLEEEDLIFEHEQKTLHLFSNILDVEFFNLKNLYEKIVNSQNGSHSFICVSPNINQQRNARLDLFYQYFEENFATELLSSRSDEIEDYKRYEKIFEVEL